LLGDLLVGGSPIGQQDQGGSLGYPLLGFASSQQGFDTLAFFRA
jgi:hypothetical protein